MADVVPPDETLAASQQGAGEQQARTSLQEEEEQLADLPIAEVNRRIAAAKAARAELLKRDELRRLQQEIQILKQYEERRGPPERPEERQRNPSSALSQHQGTDDFSSVKDTTAESYAATDLSEELPATIARNKHLRPEKLDKYKGRTQREHLEWFRSAETAFHLDPDSFQRRGTRITYAMQFLEGEPKEAWYRHVELVGWDNLPSWESFKEFLLDLVDDPANRQQSAMQKFMDSRQGPAQSAQAFHAYLSQLESQLLPYTEYQNTYHYFTKLREDLRIALTNYGDLPGTREKMVARAAALEKNLTKLYSSKAPTHRRQNDGEPPRKRKFADRPERPVATEAKPQRNDAEAPHRDTCHGCGKKGHWIKNCRSKNKQSNPNRIPTGSYAVQGKEQGKEQGKGQARWKHNS